MTLSLSSLDLCVLGCLLGGCRSTNAIQARIFGRANPVLPADLADVRLSVINLIGQCLVLSDPELALEHGFDDYVYATNAGHNAYALAYDANRAMLDRVSWGSGPA